MDIKKKKNKFRRHLRVRAKVKGTENKPRLCVFRSGRYIYAQLIDDIKGSTLLSANDIKIKEKGVKAASLVGELLAKKALEKGISAVVFDRAGYKYHGRIKALAEGARRGGFIF